ncbi:efflux RND transporter periplasmic adaptor subunit [Calorimonas adulescens]|uniref:Efflux RND transporter periplasmic adaptor subunit n=1 Tax=Calorimonas adulescens TaxID=2606906 RepID=A0A5D8QH50_9THEO|nr:efflux RND transporter periplasmic adaptor subunit [Calorimonas adulescens]TZE82883.1 efflux RND transporter periplasmic adaptor subunit [Calorimonas adulescens]
MKKFFLTLTALILILSLAGCSARTNSTQNEGVVTATQKVTRGPIEIKISGSGTLEPADEETIRLRRSGKLVQVNFKEGDVVKKGDLMYVIEDDNVALSLKQSELNLKQLNLEMEDLNKQKAGEKVTSPIDGRITAINVNEGDSVNNGTVIATIESDNYFKFTAGISQTEIGKIKVGQSVNVFLPDYLASLTGTVTSVDSSPQPTSGGGIIYNVEVQVKNPGSLKGGEKVNATIITSSGNVQAFTTTALERAEVENVKAVLAGDIEKLYVKANDTVKRGQLLATIHSDSIDSQIELQKMKIEQAMADIESKQQELKDMYVYAPISGTIVEQNVNVGDDLSSLDTSSDTVDARIVDYSSMNVVIPVDEMDVGKLKVGQEVIITSDAVQGKTFKGVISDIADEGKAENGVSTFDVKVTMDKTPELKAGMTVNADIVLEKKDNVLLVPIEALKYQGQQPYVTKVGSTEPVKVEIGLTNEQYAEVISGLNEGDEVEVTVSSGGSSFRMGPRGGEVRVSGSSGQ